MLYKKCFMGLLLMVQLMQPAASAPQVVLLDEQQTSVVKAGFGSFREQIHALRTVNALSESPGPLLEQIATCIHVDTETSEQRSLCVSLLSDVRVALNEYGAGRPKLDLIKLMMLIELIPVSEEGTKDLQAKKTREEFRSGGFIEQVQSLRRANALLESPGNLLEQIAKCRLQSDGATPSQQVFCRQLLADTRYAVDEYSAERPKLSVGALMRALSDAVDVKPGDSVTTKDGARKALSH